MKTWRSSTVRTRGSRALFLAVLLPWLSLGCEENPGETVLDPPGGVGGVVGVLSFPGIGAPPYPVAKIAPNFKASSSCSGFGAVQLAGDFNGFGVPDADFLMKHVSACEWLVEAAFDSGLVSMKFVTGATAGTVAFDNPGDYGKTGQGGNPQPLSGTLDNPTGGLGNDLTVRLPEPGVWTVKLDENAIPATYLFTMETLFPVSDPADGSFMLPDLAVGTYDFTITAEGYLPKIIRDVGVVKGQALNLGNVVLEIASGALSGTVAFSDAPDPLPTATVNLFDDADGSLVETTTTGADGAFLFTGLVTGTYDITVSAPGYEAAGVEDIDYVNGETTDVGTVTLQPGCTSDFNTIQLVGDFNGFNLGLAPFMIQAPGCVWTDTLDLAAGTYNLKLVTNGAFDTPMDYGGDETAVTVPATIPTERVSGIGTAITITVLFEGEFEFILDERVPQLIVNQLTGGGTTFDVAGSVSFAGVAAAPFPRATARLVKTGETAAFMTVRSDAATRAFRFDGVPEGSYTVTVSSPCFTMATRMGVTVSGGDVDLGAFSLDPAPSAFTTIQMVGQFTTPPFDIAVSPQMTQTDCTWEATIPLTAGSFLFKFVTDGAFDSPPDYGGTEATVLVLPGTFPIRQVSGSGTALNITVNTPGDYRFVLDERFQEFTAAPVTAAVDGGGNHE